MIPSDATSGAKSGATEVRIDLKRRRQFYTQFPPSEPVSV